MSKKSFWLSIFSILSLVCFIREPLLGRSVHPDVATYPNFHDNPYLDERMRTKMAPHLLPLDHPIKPMLDLIFSQSRAVENETTLIDAGFSIIASMPGSFVIVARHPAVPGYVFKLYLDSELRSKKGLSNCEWLTKRCIGAKKIRKLIKKKGLRYFTVPDKWLYILPLHPPSSAPHPQPVILIATDMELESAQATEYAWKHVKPKHLDELYVVLQHGYGSIRLAPNIPYTKNKKFAFIDTEYPKRDHPLKKAKIYLSKDMQQYWDGLID